MELYYNIVSPPCQSVLLVGKKLGITFDLKEVNPHLPEVREQLRKVSGATETGNAERMCASLSFN